MKKNYIFILILLILTLVSCKTNNTDETKNDNNISEGQNKEDEVEKEGSVAVIYFSATSHTKTIAEYISEYYNSAIIEITAKIEYTSLDLNYNNTSSRVYQEHNDSSIRPEIKDDIDVSSYDYIYLGYPIWWGEAPNILYTFVESANLSGKTVYPFCTSASSGIGSSATNLSNASNATFETGMRFRINDSKENVTTWLQGHNIVNKLN